MKQPPRSHQPTLITGLFALLVLALFAIQVREAQVSADRRIGLSIEPVGDGVRIYDVEANGPASRAGLRTGDLLVEIDGHPIERLGDYDIAAAEFERGQAAVYRITRGDQSLTLQVIPGSDVPWAQMLLTGLVLLTYLTLALSVGQQAPRDLRARLLIAFLFLLSLELAIPLGLVGQHQLDLIAWSLYFLVAGAQLSVELHLAAVIPDHPPGLRRRPWVLAMFYAFGLTVGLGTCATYLLEEFVGANFLPWTYFQTFRLMEEVAVPLTTLTVLILLGRSALRHPKLESRLQAGLVLVGALPRGLFIFASLVLDRLGFPVTYTFEPLYPLVLLAYPVAVFVAMYRYHLFDVEWVVRRSLLYTMLSSVLVLAFYGVLATGGTFFSRVVGPQHSLWVVSAITLVLGILFGDLRRYLKKTIDQRFYPERQVLRQRLVELASQLPAQGDIPRMGTHLVERLSKIFAASSATLLLADPRSQALLTVASSRCDREESGSLSLLLDPQDPGIDLLRRTARPVLANRLLTVSPSLARRFQLLWAELVVPLVHNGKLVGVLVLGKPETGPRYPSEEIELLELFGHQAATSFENVRLFESATYEGLTGLLRREAILDLLAHEVDRARRYRRPLTIGFADLDHFKSVNDRFGHLAGDALLKRVAEELRCGLRSTDAIGRYGGEEFLVVFPETDLAGASEVAEKLRRRVETLQVPMEDGQKVQVQVSIGLSRLDPEVKNPKAVQALINAADQALYRAKARGRNRVEKAEAS